MGKRRRVDSVIPEGHKVFHVFMNKNSGIQDAIIFAKSREELDKLRGYGLPMCHKTPHYVAFGWEDVRRVREISEETMLRLVRTEKAGYADI